MAKLNREDFKKKYNEKIADNDDLLIELLEDIDDSISEEEAQDLQDLRNEIERLTNELAETKRKYKERFIEAKEIKEVKVDDGSLTEEEVIDVKEI